MVDDLIFDVGLHRGEDTEFYLRKGFRVVSFEANPDLVGECRLKFAESIAAGRLHIVEGAIAPRSAGKTIKFYRNARASIWGTIEPDWADRNAAKGFQSQAIEVGAIDMHDAFSKFGIPHYLKIDVEGVDSLVLETLNSFPQRPQYLSIESEKVNFLELTNEFDILEQLGYKKFKVVQQRNIPGKTIETRTLDGSLIRHEFADCASGPFGDEISQPWMSRNDAIELYKKIFRRYEMFGDNSRYSKLPRVAKGVVSTLYKAATGYRGPLPGWFDTHASL